MMRFPAIAVVLFANAALAQSLHFQDVTSTAGLNYNITHRGGAAVADIDADGWDDICLWGSAALGKQLYRNNHDGTFTNVSATYLPGDSHDAVIALFGDMDNDGDPDLVTVRRLGEGSNVYEADNAFYYYENTGTGFVPALVGDPNTLAHEPTALCGGLAIGDTDLDGDLDVALGFYFGRGYFLRNDGPGVFTDRTNAFGATFRSSRSYWCLVLADFNNDGLPDLHAAIDYQHDFHARNIGNGQFIDVSEAAGVSNEGSDMGLAIGDIEDDGDLDIFSTNIARGVLYVNDGAGTFVDRAGPRGVQNLPGWAWGTAFVDLDHDGDQDLVAVALAAPSALYRNLGNGTFENATAGSGLNLLGDSLVPFDFDRDGDLDLLIAGDQGQPRLYKNISPADGTHWLIVKLRGAQSNRDSVGARVYVTAGGVTRMREIINGYSFDSGPPLYAHFGLGDSATADQLRIRWPTGVGWTLTNVAADRYLTLREPQTRDGRLIADADADCDVDIDDLSTLLEHFGSTSATQDDGDADRDGVINLTDLGILLGQFGAACMELQ